MGRRSGLSRTFQGSPSLERYLGGVGLPQRPAQGPASEGGKARHPDLRRSYTFGSPAVRPGHVGLSRTASRVLP